MFCYQRCIHIFSLGYNLLETDWPSLSLSLSLHLELLAVTCCLQQGLCIPKSSVVNTEALDFTRALPQDPVTTLDYCGPKPANSKTLFIPQKDTEHTEKGLNKKTNYLNLSLPLPEHTRSVSGTVKLLEKLPCYSFSVKKSSVIASNYLHTFFLWPFLTWTS